MKVFDGWMEAYGLTGMWSVAGVPPRGGEQALQQAVASKTVDLLDGATPGRPGDTPKLDEGAGPTVFISTEPAELIVTDGPPRFATVEGTSLEYVENTTANVFKEPTDDELYVLASGRWFRSLDDRRPMGVRAQAASCRLTSPPFQTAVRKRPSKHRLQGPLRRSRRSTKTTFRGRRRSTVIRRGSHRQ